MTALSDLVPSLKRELAVPGGYDDLFPNSTDDELTAYLADAFGEAQLYGFFASLALDVDSAETTPDLSNAGAALVCLFAGMRVLRSQIRNLSASERYKAGSVEYEIAHAGATVLRQELIYMQQRITDLIAAAKVQSRVASAYVTDNYMARVAAGSYGCFYGYEYN